MNKFLISVILICLSLPLFAQSEYLSCVTAYEEKEYRTAFDCLNEYLEKQPDNASALYYRSRIWYLVEMYDAAIEDLDAAIKHHRKEDSVPYDILYFFRGEVSIALDNYDAAMADYVQAVRYNPENMDAWFQQAELYFLQDDYAASDRVYMQILKMDTVSSRASLGLARNLIFQEEYNPAIERLNRLVQKRPRYSEIYRFRSYAYAKTSAYRKAIDDVILWMEYDEVDRKNKAAMHNYAGYEFDYAISRINSMLASGQNESRWLDLRAELYWGYDMNHEAIADYNRLENILHELTNEFYFKRGNCYEKIRDFDKAITDFKRGIEIQEDSYLYVCLANSERLKGNFRSAIIDFTNAIKTDSTNHLAYYLRGKSKAELKDNQGAAEDYSAAIDLEEDNIQAYMERGRLYREKLNDPILAKQDFQSVLDLDETYREDGNERQFALFFLGDVQEAIAWQDTLLAKHPTTGNYYDAARIYSLSGQGQEALKFLRIALEKGFNNFTRMENDCDLDTARKLPGFADLLNQWKKAQPDVLQNNDLVTGKYNK